MKIHHLNFNKTCKFQYLQSKNDVYIGTTYCLSCSQNLKHSIDDEWIECESYNNEEPKTMDKLNGMIEAIGLVAGSRITQHLIKK